MSLQYVLLMVIVLLPWSSTGQLPDAKHPEGGALDTEQPIKLPSLDEIKRMVQKHFAEHPQQFTGASEKTSLLVQQHYAGSSFFNKTWVEFKYEFGVVDGNYWMGNERLHQLTTSKRCKIRFDLLSTSNKWFWAEYSDFRVYEEATDYTMVIGGYNGTAGDSMHYSSGMRFSTRDRDRDMTCSTIVCVTHPSYGNNGGFWYNNCGNVFINSPIGVTNGFKWFGIVGADQVLFYSRVTLIPQ